MKANLVNMGDLRRPEEDPRREMGDEERWGTSCCRVWVDQRGLIRAVAWSETQLRRAPPSTYSKCLGLRWALRRQRASTRRRAAMATFELYRRSSIGMCLTEMLDEMVSNGTLSPRWSSTASSARSSQSRSLSSSTRWRCSSSNFISEFGFPTSNLGIDIFALLCCLSSP